MSLAVADRLPPVLRRFAGRLAAGSLIAVVLIAGAAFAGWGLVGHGRPDGPGQAVRLIGVGLLIIAAALIMVRFPRVADPDDPRESIYPTGAVGHFVGVRNGFGGLGRMTGVRMGLVAVMVPAVSGRYLAIGRPVDMFWALLAAIGLVLTIAAEPFVVRLLRLPAPYAIRLPGLPLLPARTRYAWLPGHAGVTAVVLAAVLGVFGAPGWSLLIVAVLGAVPSAVVIRQVRSRRRVAARIRRRLPDAIAQYGPRFVLYTARPDDASYQLTMWLPYLERAGRPFLIVTREELPAEAIAAQCAVPVVCCRAVADLDLIMTESLRAAFYVNASSGNGSLIRYHQLTHVYLGHGDSDKPPSYNPTHAMYDRIFTAGPAANRRYGDHGVLIDPAKFRVVGRPQVEAVRPPRPGRSAERMAGARPVILYAPTWKGHVSETALSSLDRAEEIVTALLDRDVEVIFRPHPFSYDDPDDAAIIDRVKGLLAADERRSDRRHRYGPAAETELDAFGCMNASDSMISDVSSVVSDFLQSGKPYAMIAPPDLDAEQFLTGYPVARAGYLVDHDLAALPRVLDELLVPAGDRLAPVRALVRADYLGDFPVEGYADHFVRAVQDVCDSPAPQITEVAESDDGSTTISRDTVRRNLAVLARTMISGAAGSVALAAAVQGWALTGVVAAGVVLFVVAITLGRQVPGDATPTLDGPRMLVVVAAGTALARDAPSPALTLAGLVLLMSLAGIAVEPAVRDALRYPGVIATGLPELAVPAAPRRSGLLTLAPAVAGVLAWLPLITGITRLVVLPVVVVVCQLAGMIFVVQRARSRLAAAAIAEERVSEILADYAPQFCVYFASGIGARYQVGMWLPYFRRLQRRFVIITRVRAMHRELVDLTAGTGIPVLYRPTLRSLEDVVVPTMRVAYYVNNAVRNTHLIERRELAHVWLNHGDSEKPACYNPVHAIYDKIFTAGQAGIDRYARHNVIIPAAKFTVVGRPQVEMITEAQGPIDRIAWPTVLYAPTWQGPYADSRVYSLPVGRSIVEALLARGVRVIFRAHPFNHRFAAARRLIADIGATLAADRERTGTDHLWGPDAELGLSVEDCFNASDAMICDVSAVISDYLAAAKPFAVVAVGRTVDQLLREAPAAAAGYPVAEDLSDLPAALDDLLGNDPKATERARMRRYYLGDLPNERAAEGFLRASRTLLEDSDRGSVPA